MIDISVEKTPELYTTDVELCLSFLKSIKNENYGYPSHPTNFHIYTDVKNEKQFLAIKSFLATQNLERTILNVWTDEDVSSNELIKPVIGHINLKVYDPSIEFKNTPLEGKFDYENAKDAKHWAQSGILRLLLLYKYGGIWFDMDMVLLRDFKPILDQEFAYMWGRFTDFGRISGKDVYGPCAALISGIKGSQFTNLCMEELLKTKIMLNTDCFDHPLMARVYRREKFTVFPSCFFDTEWQFDPKISKPIVEGWFKKNQYSNNLYLDAFAWHWHNSGQGKKEIEEGCKFDILNKLMSKKLRDRGFNI